jgi:hypothetical protein
MIVRFHERGANLTRKEERKGSHSSKQKLRTAITFSTCLVPVGRVEGEFMAPDTIYQVRDCILKSLVLNTRVLS